MKILLATMAVLFLSSTAISQELEPRVYANLPKGTNAIAVVYGYSAGNVLTDPSLPIKDFKIKAHNLGFGYVRTFAVAQKLARVQVTFPFIFMTGKLKLNGRDTTGTRNGFGDTRIRFGINLIGSPALDKKDFRQYKQETVVGVSLITSVPTGLYYKDRRINLGSNRWAFKPEVGISRRFKRVYGEVYAGVWLYTNNTSFLVEKTLHQDPVLSFQGHFCYYFSNGMWLGFNANFFNGGITTVDNQPTSDLEDNWRVGVTWSIPINLKNSIKLQAHTGAFTSTGYDYNLVTVGYQYIFF